MLYSLLFHILLRFSVPMLGLRASPVAQGKWYMLRNLQFKAKNKPTSSHVYVFYP